MPSTHTSRALGPGFGKTIAAIPVRSSLQPMCVREGDAMPTQVDDTPALFKIGLADELEITGGQIEELGGRTELVRRNRSLYPCFFSAREAAGIANRLRALD
jgi:hypothetical protein